MKTPNLNDILLADIDMRLQQAKTEYDVLHDQLWHHMTTVEELKKDINNLAHTIQVIQEFEDILRSL